tara:strand:+ start:21064 stop:21330 length:267 start_codon:yes stop_codon:yes gene_type:complete
MHMARMVMGTKAAKRTMTADLERHKISMPSWFILLFHTPYEQALTLKVEEMKYIFQQYFFYPHLKIWLKQRHTIFYGLGFHRKTSMKK